MKNSIFTSHERGSEKKKVYEKKADEMWVWEETMGIKMLYDVKLFVHRLMFKRGKN